MKLTTKQTDSGRISIWVFQVGDVVLIDDIEDVNGFLEGSVKTIPGSSGEEFEFIRPLKITVKLEYKA